MASLAGMPLPPGAYAAAGGMPPGPAPPLSYGAPVPGAGAGVPPPQMVHHAGQQPAGQPPATAQPLPQAQPQPQQSHRKEPPMADSVREAFRALFPATVNISFAPVGPSPPSSGGAGPQPPVPVPVPGLPAHVPFRDQGALFGSHGVRVRSCVCACVRFADWWRLCV
mgnify:CR=1 FL=1